MTPDLSEMPYTQAVDFTPYKYSGGSIRRYNLTARTLTVTTLSGSAPGETPTWNSTDPGEVIIYVFQPSGAVSDLTTVTIPAPAAFPSGASKLAVKVGYYPRAIDEAVATDCTAGCSLTIDKNTGNAWYKLVYLGSDNSVKYSGEAQKF